MANPFGYITLMLGEKQSRVFKKPNKDVENYLRLTHSDPDREPELPPNAKYNTNQSLRSHLMLGFLSSSSCKRF